MTDNQQVLIDALPQGKLREDNYRLVTTPLPEPGDNEVLVKTLAGPANWAYYIVAAVATAVVDSMLLMRSITSEPSTSRPARTRISVARGSGA